MSIKIIITSLLLLSVNPCEDSFQWKYLLEYKVSERLDKQIMSLEEEGFEIQELAEKGGKIINLDYFPVRVKVLPNNPKTGQRFTAEEFFKHIRLNSNHLVNKKYAVFSPSPLLGKENKELWFSENPLGAIMHINIPFPGGDGSVILTEFSSDNWIYATIRAPWRLFGQGNDGKHPVSGIRQMGFVKNNDGTYTFYTKGVDRISRKSLAIFAETFMKNPFKDADRLWQSFRQGIYDYVEQNGGKAVSLDSTKVEIRRFKWNEVKGCE